MKQKHLLKSMLLLLALIVGSASVWAQSDYSEVYTSNIKFYNSSTTESTTTVEINNVKYAAVKAGTGSEAGSTTITVPAGTKYLHIHAAGWNGETVTISISPNTNISPKTVDLTADKGVSGSGNTYTLDGTPSDYYSLITFNSALSDDTKLTFSATKGKRFVLFGFNSEEESNSNAAETTTTIDASGITNTDVYVSTAAGSLSATVTSEGTAVEGATVTWASSDESVATVSSEGAVTLVAAGTTDITASYAGDENYKPSNATYTLNVTDSTPFTGGDITFDATTDTGSSPLTKGFVTFTCTSGALSNRSEYRLYKNSVTTFSLSVEAISEGYTITTIQFTGVSGYSASGFASQDGWTTNGNNGTWTGEATSVSFTASGAQVRATKIIVTVEKADGLRNPVIDVPDTFIGSTTATITCATAGATIYYSFDNVTWTEYTEALTITATTTIYAKAKVGSDESAVVSKTTTKQLVTPTVTIDATGITNTNVYEGTAAGSLAATVTYNAAAVVGATVTWSGNNDEVATIDELTGAVTLVAAGKVTFTATFAGNADYKEATDTYELTVINTDPNGPGTVNNPYTVAQAKANTPSTGTSANVYIKGIVSAFFKADIMSDGSNFRYYISDDGTTDNQLIVYKGKGLNNNAFTSADDLQIGDEVVICGGLTIYNNAPEVAANNYIVSLIRPVISSITVDPDLVDEDADEHDGTLALAYANLTIADKSDFYIQYYNAEGEETDEPDWIEVTVAEQDPQVGEGYVVSYYMVENDGEARTAYFKVYAMDNETNLVYSNLITVTQAEYVAPEVGAAVSFDFSTNIFGMPEGSNNKTVNANDYTYSGYTINVEGSTGEGYYWNNSGYLIMGKKGASLTFPTFDFNVSKIKVYGRNGASSNVTFNIFVGEDAVSTEATSSTVDHEFLIAADKQAAGTVYTFKVTSNANAQITKIEIFGYVNVTVTDAGYATYCSTKALDFTSVEGLTAYKATIAADNNISFSKVEQVPANEGVLLKGAGTFNVPVIATAEAIENIFIGVTEPKTEDPGIFVLMDGDKGVGFYKTKNTFTVGAHTAYLPASVGARNFIALDEATAINGIAAEKTSNGEIYNLQGQRVVKAQKGLYIVNGRLQVVK